MPCNNFLTRIILLGGLCLCSFSVFAAIDVYQFKDADKQHRFQKLTVELRCPKCQNQNLADSNSEIAKDLRTKVYQMVAADKNEDFIVKYMLERYGEFVLYKPRLTVQTFLLWYGPAILLVMGFLVVVLVIRQRLQAQPVETSDSKPELNQQQQQKLAALLHSKQDNKQ